MRNYEVWLFDQLVGRLEETRRGARFSYEPEIVERYSGTPLLSLSLPVKHRPFGESKTENWFSGLLPEGERRESLCRELGINQYDWLGLLGEIGWECAGAVRVFPAGEKREFKDSYIALSSMDLAQRLSTFRSRQVHYDEGTYRMSLGGFQDKFCVAMPRIDADGASISIDKILLPLGDAPSTHILKPEPFAYRNLPESEAWAMTVASSAARCAKVAILNLENAPQTLVVERYDRKGKNWPHNVRRLHQEDGCQALGIPASDKYASSLQKKGSDPTYRAIAELLVRYSENPIEELDEMLRQMTVNFVLGNWDAHAKNISLLYTKPMTPILAPLYDVVPVADVEPRTNLMSLRIDGSLESEEIRKSSLITEAQSWGLETERAESVLDTCFKALRDGLVVAGSRYPQAGARHAAGATTRLDRLLA